MTRIYLQALIFFNYIFFLCLQIAPESRNSGVFGDSVSRESKYASSQFHVLVIELASKATLATVIPSSYKSEIQIGSFGLIPTVFTHQLTLHFQAHLLQNGLSEKSILIGTIKS